MPSPPVCLGLMPAGEAGLGQGTLEVDRAELRFPSQATPNQSAPIYGSFAIPGLRSRGGQDLLEQGVIA
jgi:hypothetical protein